MERERGGGGGEGREGGRDGRTDTDRMKEKRDFVRQDNQLPTNDYERRSL